MQTTYAQRQQQFQEKAQQLQQRYNRLSLLRLLFFFGGLALVIFLFDVSVWLAMAAMVLWLLAFNRFLNWHQAIARDKQQHDHLAAVNADECRRLEKDFEDMDDGRDFLQAQHPYAVDLDLFGPYSFFQRYSRCSTSMGRERFAQYLLQGADYEEVLARQAAIEELEPLLDWRQNFQARGRSAEDQPQYRQQLLQWQAQAPFLRNLSYMPLLLLLLPIWNLGLLVLPFLGFHWIWVVLGLLPGILLLRKYLPQVNATHAQTGRATKVLRFYGEMLREVEQQTFSQAKLQTLHTAIAGKEQGASEGLRRLSHILAQLDLRYNVFAIFINIFVLWDLQYVYRLERWKAQYGQHLANWFEALAELEALQSLATLKHNHSNWVFPEIFPDIEQAPHFFDGEALGHPHIPADKRVANSLFLPRKGHVKLITGSNMGGKSTFLRTVGLNVVLAGMGSVVCAKRLSLPLLQVYSSMRTQDALHEETSSFYAELKRLKLILEAVEKQDNILFLLDEILKGTNSRDQHRGAKALVKQLLRYEGVGLIATHDLQIGQLQAQYPKAIENLCFEVEVRDGALHFDYKKRKGVSESFNATQLMRDMGIEVE